MIEVNNAEFINIEINKKNKKYIKIYSLFFN